MKIRYTINNGNKYTYFIDCKTEKQIERRAKSRFYKVDILRIDHNKREIELLI